MQWRDATVSETGATGFEAPGSVAARQEPDVRQVFDQVSIMAVASSAAALPVGLDLPCTEDPELFFAESPEDVETAKAMCRGCEARLACLTGALERTVAALDPYLLQFRLERQEHLAPEVKQAVGNAMREDHA